MSYELTQQILEQRANRLDLVLGQFSDRYGKIQGWNVWNHPNDTVYKVRYSGDRIFEFRVRDSEVVPEQRINGQWTPIQMQQKPSQCSKKLSA